jgi:hypothetical protein
VWGRLGGVVTQLDGSGGGALRVDGVRVGIPSRSGAVDVAFNSTELVVESPPPSTPRSDPMVLRLPRKKGPPRKKKVVRKKVVRKITYCTAHYRVKKLRGAASTHPCTHCGKVAKHWAYDHADPHELTSDRGPYSPDPSHYLPLCQSCHKKFDGGTFEERFWSKVSKDILGPDDAILPAPPHPVLGTPCWIWTGGKHGIWIGRPKKMHMAAHRVAYALTHEGDLPDDFDTWQLRRRCGDPRCVNPHHMELRGQWRRDAEGNSHYPPIFQTKEPPPRTPKPRLPGLWQRAMLAKLEEVESFYLVDLLPDGYTVKQYRSLCVSAYKFYKQGRISKRRFQAGSPRAHKQLVISRPGVVPQRPEEST